jgi:hypothetical protein
MIGFMAHLEQPPQGVFYLCARPIEVDEAGGGTADLPVDAVRVVVRSAAGRSVAPIGRAVEVTGKLDIGARVESDGSVSHIRLLLEGPR